MNENTIDIYETGDDTTPYVAKMFVKKSKNSKQNICSNVNVHTIIILDVSGSMNSHVTRIITKYFPATLLKLGYDQYQDFITLITFSAASKIYTYSGFQLRSSRQVSESTTYMKPAINNLRNVIFGSHFKQFRILTISDGELHDQIETLNAATNLANEIKDKYAIRSSAIRLFTNTQQPDTRGLASILQLNNGADNNLNTKLIDLQCPTIDEEFENVFCTALTDNLGFNVYLTAKKPIFKSDPWAISPKAEIYLSEGTNTFWLSDITDINVNNELIRIEIKASLDLNNFNCILKEKIDYYIERLKLLKVVDMSESKKEIEQIINYFTKLEQHLAFRTKFDDEVDITNDTSIKTRYKFFKNRALRQSKSIIQEISAIANHEKVSQLNSAQQANFLRNIVNSSNAINLAKRGIKHGLDFDVKAIEEVKQMKQHLHEIANIDDSQHAVSFYSQATTLEGIKSVCALDDEYRSIERLAALDILSLLNIVGIQANADIGEFCDPKTYHLKDIMLGTFVSLSDVITVKQQKKVLTNPYDRSKEINTVVPFYDDDRIQQFLLKYAPNLMEYMASIGMRNMIINIPNTYRYTVVGGVWWMARKLQDYPTEANANLFTKFVHTYKTAVGTLFDYVPDLIKPMSDADTKNNLSLYIANNGTTNMIGPLIAIQNSPEKLAMMPNILRALYTFEFYQVMKKFYRTDSDGHIKRKQMLDKLLGIDYDKYATPLPPMFESQKVPEHHRDYHINLMMLKEISDRVFWVDYICKLSDMFGYALKNDIQSLISINLDGKIDESVCEKTLNINYMLTQEISILKKFKFYNMAQGLMFDTLASRYDDVNSKMKIEDTKDEKRMDTILHDYIKRQYHSHYQSSLSKQNKLEIEILTQELITNMINTKSIHEFNKLFKDGLTKNHVHVEITDVYKQGFDELKDKLFNPKIVCAERSEKLRVLILGCDREENVIYNKNNTIGMSTADLSHLTELVGCHDMWVNIYDKYVEKSIHLYRESGPNRHAHWNIKPSYWARGYKNLGEYFKNISVKEQQEYCRIHTDCCGILNGKPYRWA